MLTYLGLELQSLGLYILVSMHKSSVLSLEAALKYYLFGSVSSALILFGISILYGVTGSLDLYVISYLFSSIGFFDFQRSFLSFGLFFLLFGFFFKFAIFPFHAWAPDVYDGSN